MKPFNWNVKEEDVHSFIIEVFEKKGFECLNFHQSGASIERGIDVLAKGEEKIAIAVKLKPKKADLRQLSVFMRNKYKRKIFVYLSSPTRDFNDELELLEKKHNIEVMDSNKLHNFLIENKSAEYLGYYLFSHEIFRDLSQILCLWLSEREARVMSVVDEDLPLMWRLKDKSVSFHKVSKTFYDYLCNRVKKIEDESQLSYKNYLEVMESFLSYIGKEVGELKCVFEEIKRKNPGLLAYLWRVCEARSGWSEILNGITCSKDVDEILFFWICAHMPDESYVFVLSWFYKISELAEEFENGADWIFADRKGIGKRK